VQAFPLLRRRTVVAVASAVPAALLLAASLVRVPGGTIGVWSGALHGAGWHLRAPLRRARIVPLSGRFEALDIQKKTAEGSALDVRLSFDYRLEPGPALASQAEEIEREGFEGTAARLGGAALEQLPLEVLLPPGLPAGSAQVPLPPAAVEVIARAFRSAGIETSGLAVTAGPKGSPGTGEAESPAARAPVPERTGRRLLLIGLDGADWDTIDPLLGQGRLPNLARLIATGIRGPLRSYDPMVSPLLWTTMVTGVGPDRHGIADFQAIDETTGRRVPISSRFRKVKALWNILSDAGLSSGFVAWWASYPAEKVDGFQVSNLTSFQAMRPKAVGVPAPPALTFPPDYFDRVRPLLRTAADLTYDEILPILKIDRAEFEAARAEVLRPPAAEENANRKAMERPVALATSILTGSKNYAVIAADLAGRRLALTAVYFEGIDMMGHRFQHCMPPRLPICSEHDFARYRDAVTSFYARQDELLGPILKAAGPETTVMVVSDHGFKTGEGRPVDLLPYTTEQPVEWHDEEGVFLLSGPAARRGEHLASRPTLFDITPTILYLMGLPAAENMPGHALLGALDPSWVRDHPIRTIASYDALGAPREIASGGGAEEAEEELLSNLRALGYIGGDTAAPKPVGGSARAGAAPGAQTQVFYHRNLATYFLKRQDYAKAAEQLRLANEREKLPKTYQMLSEAYAGLGKVDQAIAALEDGLRSLENMDSEAVLWLVRIDLSRPGGREVALDAVRRHASRTAKKPGLDDAIAGLLAEDARNAQAAADLYRRSLAADPTRVIAADRLFAIEGLPAAAELEPMLRRALAKDRRIDEYHNLLGMILASRGRPADAVAELRRAADLDPDNPRFAANLASALARVERWDEAAETYERAAALDPSAGNFLKLGSVYRRLRRPDRALAAFERARAAGDGGSGPILGIALARADMNQIPEALSIVREGLGSHPDDSGLRSLYDDLLRRTRSPGSAPGPPGSGR